MTHNRDEGWQSLAEVTARIISAYLEKHAADVSVEALPKLVGDVRAALVAPTQGQQRQIDLDTLSEQEYREKHEPSSDWWPEADRLMAQEAARVEALRAEPEIIPPQRQTSQIPAVPIGQEITSDYIICLEEGKRCRSMRGHLRAKHGLTPEQYRKKWGLPEDYKMVPPNYSAVRRQISNQLWKNKKKDRP